jgi:hypothetical protein
VGGFEGGDMGQIGTLRQEPGGDIMTHGGAAFAQALSRQHLIGAISRCSE